MAVGPDGSLYIADGNNLVRKVSPSGIITTIAGGGHAAAFCDINSNDYPWFDPTCGNGGLARQAGFDVPRAFAVDSDGSMYVTEDGNSVIRRIAPNGIVTRVAGTGVQGYSGDGGPATAAKISAGYGIAVGPDGSLYLADFHRIRRVSPDGIITTIAGNGSGSTCGNATPITCTDRELATSASISPRHGIAIGPDGSVYFGTYQGDNRIRRIVLPFASYTGGAIAIASEDGAAVYEFDARGRHLRTRDALTKQVLLPSSTIPPGG